MVPDVLLILVPAPSRGPVPPSPLSPVQVEVVPRAREDLSTGHHLAVAWATAARQKKRMFKFMQRLENYQSLLW